MTINKAPIFFLFTVILCSCSTEVNTSSLPSQLHPFLDPSNKEAVNAFVTQVRAKGDPAARKGNGDAYNNMAIVYDLQDTLDRALGYHMIALDKYIQTSKNAEIAKSYNNTAIVNVKKGDTQSAIIQYEHAVEIFSRLNEMKPWLAHTLRNYGLCLRERGDHLHAKEKFSTALVIWQELGNDSEINRLREELGLSGERGQIELQDGQTEDSPPIDKGPIRFIEGN